MRYYLCRCRYSWSYRMISVFNFILIYFDLLLCELSINFNLILWVVIRGFRGEDCLRLSMWFIFNILGMYFNFYFFYFFCELYVCKVFYFFLGLWFLCDLIIEVILFFNNFLSNFLFIKWCFFVVRNVFL